MHCHLQSVFYVPITVLFAEDSSMTRGFLPVLMELNVGLHSANIYQACTNDDSRSLESIGE